MTRVSLFSRGGSLALKLTVDQSNAGYSTARINLDGI